MLDAVGVYGTGPDDPHPGGGAVDDLFGADGRGRGDPVVLVVVQLVGAHGAGIRDRFLMATGLDAAGLVGHLLEPGPELGHVGVPHHHRGQPGSTFFPDLVLHAHRRIQLGG
ncbi:hypothetical protein ACFFX0_25850 [Citricoccus parietis]|uniref:Uncharacterized protein n=1 Tax=Citricoccus parietis TaxID=592307 RepID=A0ABV5G656_9MICC